MIDKSLIELFYKKYTNKQETLYRLPIDVDIEEFWPEELAYREKKSVSLPLHTADGEQYFYNRTERFVRSADAITEMARNDSGHSVFSELSNASVIDEAYYSSVIEGAYSTRAAAHHLIETGKEPENKDERMILNNYRALQYVLEYLDYPVSEQMVITIAKMLTEGTLEKGELSGYRNDTVYVVSHTGKTVYTAPDAGIVKPMMDELLAYINDPMIHPVEKAVISHVYFVTVHPFFDGNGRTARALTYMILLKAGYDFFRLVPISGILSDSRSGYYKALHSCQDPCNGNDYTYFTDFYTELLSDTLTSARRKVVAMEKYEHLKKSLDPENDTRLIKGAMWIASSDITTVTAAKWQSKFGLSFETARKDLMKLEQNGFLTRRAQGHKIFFDFL